jgi:cell division protein FtsI/penicillin-binding protein 2
MTDEVADDHGSGARVRAEAPSSEHIGRIRFIRVAFLLVAAFIAIRLLRLQIDPDLKLGKNDLSHIGTVELSVPRGSIYDAKNRLLATDRLMPSIWADPREVEDPHITARAIASTLQMDEQDLIGRLSRRDDRGQLKKFVWVKRFLTEAEIVAFGDFERPEFRGLHIKKEPTRFYPQKDIAAHVVGFVNKERVASAGVELTHDKYLRSTPGAHTARKDARRVLLDSLTLQYVEPQGGDGVHLTIDSAVQRSLEAALDQALIDAKAPKAMGFIMNPKTGAIVAMACRPGFDPNTYSDYPEDIYRNAALIDVFEPGSAFKIVAAAAAIECGLVTPETFIDCHNGSFKFFRHTIHDFHPLGVEPFRTCFAQSSNIAIITVANWLGQDRFASWIDRFGFGQGTSSDFDRIESHGILRPVNKWQPSSMGALPMGQEIAVTMPQLAVAFSVIANGGFKIEPHVVEQIVDRDGYITYKHRPPAPKRVISSETAAVMRDLMSAVVSDVDGTGRYASIDRYRVAGKTGTAQVARPKGGYIPGKFTAIFAGFAPVADPRLCAVIVVHEPAIKLHYGGYICGPIFKKVIGEALTNMAVPEDPVEQPLDSAGLLLADADTVTEHIELAPLETLREFVVETSDGLKLVTQSEDGIVDGPVLPDFTGMTKRKVHARMAALGLRWDVQGSGWVVAQDPPPNTPLGDVTVCRLTFADKTEIRAIEHAADLDAAKAGASKRNPKSSTSPKVDQLEDGNRNIAKPARG